MTPPREPTGAGKIAVWLRDLLRFAKSNQVRSGVNYKVRRTPEGTILEIAPGGGIIGAPGMHYEGEWDSGETYSSGDVVRKRTGTGMGVWVCVLDGAESDTPPMYPEPVDAGSGANAWELISFCPIEVTRCSDGVDSTMTINGTTETA